MDFARLEVLLLKIILTQTQKLFSVKIFDPNGIKTLGLWMHASTRPPSPSLEVFHKHRVIIQNNLNDFLINLFDNIFRFISHRLNGAEDAANAVCRWEILNPKPQYLNSNTWLLELLPKPHTRMKMLSPLKSNVLFKFSTFVTYICSVWQLIHWISNSGFQIKIIVQDLHFTGYFARKDPLPAMIFEPKTSLLTFSCLGISFLAGICIS